MSIPSRYGSTRSTHVSFGTADNPPDRENPIKGAISFPAFSLENSEHIGVCFSDFQFHHALVEYKRNPTTGPQTVCRLLDTNIN